MAHARHSSSTDRHRRRMAAPASEPGSDAMYRLFAILGLIPLLAATAGESAPQASREPAAACAAGGLLMVAGAGAGAAGLEPESLESRWTALEPVAAHTPTCIGRDRVVLGSRSGLRALAADTGQVLWHRPDLGHVYSPVARDDSLFVATLNGRLERLDPEQAETRWRRHFDGWLFPPVVGTGVVATGGQGRVLYGVTRTAGKDLWQRSLDQELVWRPVHDPNRERVIITTYAGTIAAFALEDGSPVWQVNAGSPAQRPALAGERLYAGTLSGALLALDAETGAERWRVDVGARIATAVGVSDDGHLLAVPTRPHRDRGMLHLIDAETGRTRCRRHLPGPATAAPRFRPQGLVVPVSRSVDAGGLVRIPQPEDRCEVSPSRHASATGRESAADQRSET